MKYTILFVTLASLCGCKPSTSEHPSAAIDVDPEDPCAMLLYDFRQVTKYPEFTDDDYGTGDFNYWFYPEDDFLNVSISGVTDEEIIAGALKEFKSVMKKRNVTMPVNVYIYEKTIPTSETTATSTGLISEFEINEIPVSLFPSAAPPQQRTANEQRPAFQPIEP